MQTLGVGVFGRKAPPRRLNPDYVYTMCMHLHVHYKTCLHVQFLRTTLSTRGCYYNAGCELTGGCSASAIGDHMCSVGSGLQCLCQHPRLTGDSNTCADGVYVHWEYIICVCVVSFRFLCW